MEHDVLISKAHNAYRRSRTVVALKAFCVAWVMCAVLCVWIQMPWWSWVVCAGVACAYSVCGFYGLMHYQGARVGLLGGFGSSLVSLLAHPAGHAYSMQGVCVPWCMFACMAGGVLCGAMLTAYAPSWRMSSWSYYGTAFAMVLALQSLACSCAGFTAVFACVVTWGVLSAWQHALQPFLKGFVHTFWRE
jgi:hypothetical protein